MIYFSDSNNSNPNSTNIVFQCSDFKRDTGLLLLKRKGEGKFEIHLHNDYTNQAIAMELDQMVARTKPRRYLKLTGTLQ